MNEIVNLPLLKESERISLLDSIRLEQEKNKKTAANVFHAGAIPIEKTLVSSTVTSVLLPLSLRLFGLRLHSDDFFAFAVEYEKNEQAGMEAHLDESDVTFNTCLGHSFKGGELVFDGAEIAQVPGNCVAHLGNRVHSAKPVTGNFNSPFILHRRKES